METDRYYDIVSKYAVKITKNDKSHSLLGSGVIFPRKTISDKLLVLTAAHVVSDCIKESDVNSRGICINFNGCDGKIYENIEVSDVGQIDIHQNFNKTDYKNDIAIITIPWMDNLDISDEYIIQSGKRNEEVFGYGFPRVLDSLTKKSNSLEGRNIFRGNIDDYMSDRLVISYKKECMRKDADRDRLMLGYSGTGLFSIQNKKLILNGIISGGRGDKFSENQLYASDASLFNEMLAKHGTEILYPSTFEEYSSMVEKEFDCFRKNTIAWWNDTSVELLKSRKIVPKLYQREVENKLLCRKDRRSCDEFWKEKLKELVILYGVTKKTIQELDKIVIQLPVPYEQEQVKLEFICTEDRAEIILGKLIDNDYFSDMGEYENGLILLVNGKEHHNREIQYSRMNCRMIMSNIVEGFNSNRSLKRKTSQLLSVEDKENTDFDIVKGMVKKCNIAAIGSSSLMTILNLGNEEKMKDKMDSILTELWEVQ